MNPKLYATALFAMIGLAAVSAAIDKAFMKDLSQSYGRTLKELPEEEKDDLDSFKQLLLLQSGDIYTVYDLFFDIPEVALSRAIIGFLQQKTGPYELSEEEKPKYTEDYQHKLVEPCKDLKKIWHYPLSQLRSRETLSKDKGAIKSIKAEYDVYEWLETAEICYKLLDQADSMAEKSFRYMLTHKPRGRRVKLNQKPESQRVEGVAEQEYSVSEHPEKVATAGEHDDHIEGVPTESDQFNGVGAEDESEAVEETTN